MKFATKTVLSAVLLLASSAAARRYESSTQPTFTPSAEAADGGADGGADIDIAIPSGSYHNSGSASGSYPTVPPVTAGSGSGSASASTSFHGSGSAPVMPPTTFHSGSGSSDMHCGGCHAACQTPSFSNQERHDCHLTCQEMWCGGPGSGSGSSSHHADDDDGYGHSSQSTTTSTSDAPELADYYSSTPTMPPMDEVADDFGPFSGNQNNAANMSGSGSAPVVPPTINSGSGSVTFPGSGSAPVVPPTADFGSGSSSSGAMCAGCHIGCETLAFSNPKRDDCHHTCQEMWCGGSGSGSSSHHADDDDGYGHSSQSSTTSTSEAPELADYDDTELPATPDVPAGNTQSTDGRIEGFAGKENMAGTNNGAGSEVMRAEGEDDAAAGTKAGGGATAGAVAAVLVAAMIFVGAVVYTRRRKAREAVDALDAVDIESGLKAGGGAAAAAGSASGLPLVNGGARNLRAGGLANPVYGEQRITIVRGSVHGGRRNTSTSSASYNGDPTYEAPANNIMGIGALPIYADASAMNIEAEYDVAANVETHHDYATASGGTSAVPAMGIDYDIAAGSTVM